MYTDKHHMVLFYPLWSVFVFIALTRGTRPVLPRHPHRTSLAAAVAQRDHLKSVGRRRSIARGFLKRVGDLGAEPEPQRSFHWSSAKLWSQ